MRLDPEDTTLNSIVAALAIACPWRWPHQMSIADESLRQASGNGYCR
jgi:hypothetical protein